MNTYLSHRTDWYYRSDIADHWCPTCEVVTDYCQSWDWDDNEGNDR